jgi:hypothetical protein
LKATVPVPRAPTQTLETRRFRWTPLANAVQRPSPNVIATFCFPNGGAGYRAFRILKVDVWSTDAVVGTTGGTSSRAISVYLRGEQSTAVSGSIVTYGDRAVFEDIGTAGADRAQVHVIPAKEFAIHWWQVGDTNSVVLEVASLPLTDATSTAVNIVDFVAELISTT